VTEAKCAVGEMSAPEAADAAEGGKALLLDVREAEELKQDGYIDGSLHIPRGVLESRADPDSSAADDRLTTFYGGDRLVYVLCASGARAAMAAQRLSEMGYHAQPVQGGLKEWRDAGLPFQHSA